MNVTNYRSLLSTIANHHNEDDHGQDQYSHNSNEEA